MIISHKYRFIFIKTRKTAGTSIEVALSKICGKQDIVTPIGPPVEGHEPRNNNGFYNHIGAKQIKARILPEIWDSYYKFTFERNPFDKVVSWYWWLYKQQKTFDSFEQCIEKRACGSYKLPVDYEKYTIDGKVVVDFIGKYETLLEDFTYICNRLEIPFDGKLTREKGDARIDKSDYRTYYSEASKKIIEDAFYREISLFGYHF